MYRRAFAFMREAGYGLPQWGQTPRENPGAVGYLFADDDGRVVGAAGFQSQDKGSPWRAGFHLACPPDIGAKAIWHGIGSSSDNILESSRSSTPYPAP